MTDFSFGNSILLTLLIDLLLVNCLFNSITDSLIIVGNQSWLIRFLNVIFVIFKHNNAFSWPIDL
jgi:hypothetical protein